MAESPEDFADRLFRDHALRIVVYDRPGAAVAVAARDAAIRQEALAPFRTPRPRDEWNEEDGNVLWWLLPITEPPYCGTPLDDEFPDYVTHWTPLVEPIPATPEETKP